MTTPRLTVITPTHNDAATIEQTICSVLDQGYQNLEFMIVDRGSHDATPDLVDIYAPELAWRGTKPNATAPEAINAALEHATGDLVAVLEGKDLYGPGALDAVADFWQRRNQPAWLSGHTALMDADSHTLAHHAAHPPVSLGPFLMHAYRLGPLGSHFVDRNVLESVGRFDPNLHHSHGYECFCRLLRAGILPAVVTGTCLTHYRQPHNSCDPRAMLASGMENIAAAQRHASALPLPLRYRLWKNLDRRRRIFALAEAEIHTRDSGAILRRLAVLHPWWLASGGFRRALFHGCEHPVPEKWLTPAA